MMPRSLRYLPVALLLGLATLGTLLAVRRTAPEATPLEGAALQRAVAAARAMPLSVEAPRVTLYDRDERAVPLESYRGRLVFVNYWATWCGPCVAEMPSLIALQAALDPADIAFVSIAEDDTWPPVDAYLRRTPLPFDVFRDRPPRVETQFEVTSYPTSFLIDRDGRALYRFGGARDWSAPEVRELLRLRGVHLR